MMGSEVVTEFEQKVKTYCMNISHQMYRSQLLLFRMCSAEHVPFHRNILPVLSRRSYFSRRSCNR